MTYVACRLFSGSSSRSIKELSDIAKQELATQLAKAGGLIRYITLEAKDGRIGSYSAYEDQSAAERARKIATEWISSTDVMSDYKLAESYEGELVASLSGKAELRAGAAGIIRIYATDASDEDLKAAVEETRAAVEAIPGLIRFNLVRLSSGGAATFSSFDTQENANQLTQVAKNARNVGGSQMQKAFPQAPEQIDVTLIDIFTP